MESKLAQINSANLTDDLQLLVNNPLSLNTLTTVIPSGGILIGEFSRTLVKPMTQLAEIIGLDTLEVPQEGTIQIYADVGFGLEFIRWCKTVDGLAMIEQQPPCTPCPTTGGRSLGTSVTDHMGFVYFPEDTYPLFDSNTKEYRVVYRFGLVNKTSTPKKVGLQISNLPNFTANPNYLPEFQARDLSTPNERSKINTIAKNLNPNQLMYGTGMTIGSPIAVDINNEEFVLGGNGRSLALSKASNEKYDEYLQAVERSFPELWAVNKDVIEQFKTGDLRPIIYREAFNLDGGNLTLREAIMLAGASQESTSAEESPLRKTLSIVRGLGMEGLKAEQVPVLNDPYPLNRETILRFTNGNPAFTKWVRSKLPPAVNAQWDNVNDENGR